MNMFKRRVVSSLLLLVLVVTSVCFELKVEAAPVTAISIKLVSYKGDYVYLYDKSGNSLTVEENKKIYTGYIVETGKSSSAYLSLDDKKAVKLDQNTKVELKKEGGKNELNVIRGKLFFDVTEKLKSNESLTVRTSNLSMGIRGTIGEIEYTEENNFMDTEDLKYRGFQMAQIYEGESVVDYEDTKGSMGSAILKPGEKISKYQLGLREGISPEQRREWIIEKKKLILDDIPAFALREMINNPDTYKRINASIGYTKGELNGALQKAEALEESRLKDIEKSKADAKKDADSKKTVVYEGGKVNGELGEERKQGTESEDTDVDTGGENGGFSGGFGGDSNVNPPEDLTQWSKMKVEADGTLSVTDLNNRFSKVDKVEIEAEAPVKTLTLDGSFKVPVGKTLSIGENITFQNGGNNITIAGELINYGNESLVIEGELINESTGIITNKGAIRIVREYLGNTIKNWGTIKNEGTMDLSALNFMENWGTIKNEGTMDVGYASIHNKAGGTLTLNGTYIPNLDMPILNAGTVNGTNVEANPSLIVQSGTIEFVDQNSNLLMSLEVNPEYDGMYNPLAYSYGKNVPKLPEGTIGWDSYITEVLPGKVVKVQAVSGRLAFIMPETAASDSVPIALDSFEQIQGVLDIIYSVDEEYKGRCGVTLYDNIETNVDIDVQELKVLDLNGYNITFQNSRLCFGSGNIKDSSNEGTGKLIGNYWYTESVEENIKPNTLIYINGLEKNILTIQNISMEVRSEGLENRLYGIVFESNPDAPPGTESAGILEIRDVKQLKVIADSLVSSVKGISFSDASSDLTIIGDTNIEIDIEVGEMPVTQPIGIEVFKANKFSYSDLDGEEIVIKSVNQDIIDDISVGIDLGSIAELYFNGTKQVDEEGNVNLDNISNSDSIKAYQKVRRMPI